MTTLDVIQDLLQETASTYPEDVYNPVETALSQLQEIGLIKKQPI